jgi:quinohemoprotein ethanol dehydrogenase
VRIALLGLAATALAASGLAQAPAPRLRATPAPAPVRTDWRSTGNGDFEQHFSPLDRINDRNVGRLGLAWYADLKTDRGQEATPLMVDGVLYNTEPWNITTAYDARTGRELWRYDPQVPLKYGRLACCDIVTRGLGFADGRIYIGTLDGRLIALEAKSGRELWSVQTTDPAKPYTITGVPRVFDGMVLIGNGGAELGVRGYVTAYDAQTGEQLWRWYTVPGNPADGFENAAMRAAAATWTGEWWRTGGGGTVWDSIAYDPRLGLVYIGTGNGSPWAQKWRSPGGGDNLYLASIVALDARTGEYRWHYQTVPGEEWDYTATQQMILADLWIDGRARSVLMQAPKNGFFYMLDRETGELLSASQLVPVNWASGIDMRTGRPVENAAVRYGTSPVLVSPGPGGAHNWNAMAYNPFNRLVYVPVAETYMAYAAAASFDPARGGLGTSFAGYADERRTMAEYSDAHSKGWLVAWDPVRRREVWRTPNEQKGSGGVLATAGNLVFQGNIGKTFTAYRADTGEKVWEMPVQNVPISAPIAYMLDGEQYIAVNVGWGGGLAHVERANYTELTLGPPRLLVFKLGGTAHLPPMPVTSMRVPELVAPPALTGTPEQVALGEGLYAAHCALCHGAGARGGVKDLRHMEPATHAAFIDIVLGGARARNGMASFADTLSPAEAEAIHHYLISRARADWEN